MHLHLHPRFMQLAAALRWRRDALGPVGGVLGGAREAAALCSEAGRTAVCCVSWARPGDVTSARRWPALLRPETPKMGVEQRWAERRAGGQDGLVQGPGAPSIARCIAAARNERGGPVIESRASWVRDGGGGSGNSALRWRAPRRPSRRPLSGASAAS